ncbi:DUF222 domain-containing protein [Actinoplanes sp. M2I2]|uniref:DUF222 domain-containing protein n=1 Tax=Actinoplanes sp. M2I2 TaxID=1734444 RepID=UPI0035B43006
MADVRQLSEDTAKLAATALWPLADDELTACLKEARRLEQCAAALQARLVHQAITRALPTAQGHRSTPSWLRTHLLLDPQPARELAAQAAALTRHPAVEQAVWAGHLNLRQSTVIAETLDALPDDLAHHDYGTTPDDAAADDGHDGHDGHDRHDCHHDGDKGGSGHDDCGCQRDGDKGGSGHDNCGCHRDRDQGSDGNGIGNDGNSDCHRAGDKGSNDPDRPHDRHDGAGDDYPSRSDGQDCGDDQNGHDVSRLVELAQTTMIGMAERLPAYQLRRVGERILAHVAPELAERADEAALARQEARAHRRRKFTLSLPSDGLVRISGLLGTEDAAIMHAALHPLCTPTPGDDRTAEHRRADALIDICRLALRTGELPADGGEPPQLAVTVAYDLLTRLPLVGIASTGSSGSGTSHAGASGPETVGSAASHGGTSRAGALASGTSGSGASHGGTSHADASDIGTMGSGALHVGTLHAGALANATSGSGASHDGALHTAALGSGTSGSGASHDGALHTAALGTATSGRGASQFGTLGTETSGSDIPHSGIRNSGTSHTGTSGSCAPHTGTAHTGASGLETSVSGDPQTGTSSTGTLGGGNPHTGTSHNRASGPGTSGTGNPHTGTSHNRASGPGTSGTGNPHTGTSHNRASGPGTSGDGNLQTGTSSEGPLVRCASHTVTIGNGTLSVGARSAGTLSIGTTDTGLRLSAATMRRLACDARILPFVLGGAGQILDTGRARRLATGPLRRALHLRDQGCAFPDCDRPPRWTDAHHLIPWTSGGPTTLNNLVLLCRHHHRLIHHPGGGWQIRLGPDQHPDFYPPPSIDPLRRPRRNLYHRRQ